MLETKLFGNSKEEQDKLNCCEECASNYEKEAQLFKPGQKKLLPSWLQSHTTEVHQKVAKKFRILFVLILIIYNKSINSYLFD